MKNRERQRENRKLGNSLPMCDHRSCAGNKYGYCRILKSNHFGEKVCPFYKTTEQNEREKKAVMDRLIAMGRQDLIDTYYGGKEGGVDDGC
jgi:hypothetical protein